MKWFTDLQLLARAAARGMSFQRVRLRSRWSFWHSNHTESQITVLYRTINDRVIVQSPTVRYPRSYLHTSFRWPAHHSAHRIGCSGI